MLSIMALVGAAYAQIKTLTPSSIRLLEFSPAHARAYEARMDSISKIEEKLSRGFPEAKLTERERYLLADYDDVDPGYWETIPRGCSWYCGAMLKGVTASSTLKPQGKMRYDAEQAHDFSYETVWAEGAKGYGIGEYLEYTFSGSSPRITEIIVANGYVKSVEAWRNNSRVKKLKVYFNDKPLVILHLEDKRSVQSFAVDPIGMRSGSIAAEDYPDWKLRFEIMEVYRGDKYDDVVISELFFDGIDVHCLVAGTPILMANNTTKPIEALQEGDDVAYWDATSGQLKSAQVMQLVRTRHGGLVTYHFESGRQITATADHPFMVVGKGWASLDPQKSLQYGGYNGVALIQPGDIFFAVDKEDKLLEIVRGDQAQETYTITELSEGDNFVANGLVVGLESL